MLKLFTAALLCHMVLNVASYGRKNLKRREWVEDKNDYLKVCLQAPIEIGIILDASGSIETHNFEKAKEFLQDFVSQYKIGNGADEGVRFSVITYGEEIYRQDAFNLTTYNTKDELVEAFGKIPYREGGGTYTHEAIKFMREHQLARGLTRPGVDRISIVITDGNSDSKSMTKKEAELARQDNITMYAIGVGTNILKNELLNIAGDASRVTMVDNYGKLKDIKEDLARQTCVKKEEPTTTRPPQIQSCGELNPADVYFVFSPASLGDHGTAWTTCFISQAISAEDMDVGFRYGAVTNTCPEAAGFDLDGYDNIEDIKTRLQTYERSRMPTLVQQVITDGYTEDRGARPDAARVAVLVASNRRGEDLSAQVQALQENGIRVFIADPFEQGVNIPGVMTLYGRSPEQQAEDLISALCPLQSYRTGASNSITGSHKFSCSHSSSHFRDSHYSSTFYKSSYYSSSLDSQSLLY